MTGREIRQRTERAAAIDGAALGRLLRSQCIAAGLTQSDLAAMSGASRSSVSRWARGEARDHAPVLLRILVALGLVEPPPAFAPKMVKGGRSRSKCKATDGNGEPCPLPYSTHGYCAGHYYRVRKYGEPLADWPLGRLPHNLAGSERVTEVRYNDMGEPIRGRVVAR